MGGRQVHLRESCLHQARALLAEVLLADQVRHADDSLQRCGIVYCLGPEQQSQHDMVVPPCVPGRQSCLWRGLRVGVVVGVVCQARITRPWTQVTVRVLTGKQALDEIFQAGAQLRVARQPQHLHGAGKVFAGKLACPGHLVAVRQCVAVGEDLEDGGVGGWQGQQPVLGDCLEALVEQSFEVESDG